MQKLSKALYLGFIIGAEAAGMLCLTIGAIVLIAAGVVASINEGNFDSVNMGLIVTGIVFLMIGMVLALVAMIFGYVLLYKAWKVIQDGQPRTTPGKAVGFLFIPFFNLYWMFVAYWGWAQDFNKYIAAKGLNLTPVPAGLFLAYPIIILCSAVPYVNSLVGLALIIVFIIMCNQMINAVNGVIAARDLPAA